MPEVSVIIPVYNTSAFLKRCVDSLIAQTFADWELILVDDGSTDDSGAICDEYVATDTRIRVIHNLNQGVSASRNCGIGVATGRWIAFIDSDDSVDPDYLDLLLSASDGCDMVAVGYKEVGPQVPRKYSFVTKVLERRDFVEFFKYPNWGFVWGRLFKASVIKRNHLTFDPKITFREDNLFVWDILMQSKKLALVSGTTYNYSVGTTLTTDHIKTFDKEQYAFERAKKLASELSLYLGTKDVYKYINLMGFLYHAVFAVYRGDISRKERLGLLRQLDFDKSMFYPQTDNSKTRFLNHCLLNRWWLVYDLIVKR